LSALLLACLLPKETVQGRNAGRKGSSVVVGERYGIRLTEVVVNDEGRGRGSKE